MADKKVMIVEDENIVAKDIKNCLKGLGYAVPAIASSGEEAIKKAMELQPDLVLMDIKLEGDIDGVQAAEQIRSKCDIPVVYLTAFTDEKTLQRAKITEPYGYIIKPFGQSELHSTVEIALYKHEMEKKLKESEKWLSTVLKSVDNAVIATDMEGQVTLLNPVAESLTGWKEKEAIGKPIKDVFIILNEGTLDPVEGPVKTAIRRDIVVDVANHILIGKGGATIPVGDSAAPIRNEKGKVVGGVLVFRDISERKRAEEALKESWERYRELAESISDVFFAMDKDLKYTYWNKACEDLTEISARDAIGRSIFEIFPDNGETRRAVKVYKKVIKTKQPQTFINEYHLKGKRNFFEISAYPSKDGLSVFVKDITQRKRVVKELQRSQEILTSFMEAATDNFSIWDSELNLVEVNEAGLKMFPPGTKKEDLIGKNMLEITPRIRETGRYDEYMEVVKTGEPFFAEDIIPEPTLGGRHLNLRAFKVGDGLGVIATDITERKKMEKALLEREEKYRTLFESSPEAVVLFGIDGAILDCNDAAVEITGTQKKELIGKTFTELGKPDEKDLPKITELFLRAISGKVSGPFDMEVQFNGRKRQVEVFPAPLRKEGKAHVLQAIIRDITERKLTEEQIKSSLKEKDLLLRETHHRFKNNLQVISSLLNLQSRYIKDENTSKMFKECQNRVKSMALIHEKLYRSRDMVNVDFTDYARTLTVDLFKSYSVDSVAIKLKMNGEDVILGIDTAIRCGLIVNELVLNCLKHAFPDGREGEIYVDLRSNEENRCTMIVGDNGIGFPQDLDFRNTESLGMQLVTALVGQLKGTIELDRSGGTAFKIEFEEKMERGG